MNSMSRTVASVSDHSGASTPSTAASGTPGTSAPGSQSYASRTPLRPGHVSPRMVEASYLMSR